MDEFLEEIVRKIRGIAVDGKDAGELRSMFLEYAKFLMNH
jgi:hypothetical protein